MTVFDLPLKHSNWDWKYEWSRSGSHCLAWWVFSSGSLSLPEAFGIPDLGPTKHLSTSCYHFLLLSREQWEQVMLLGLLLYSPLLLWLNRGCKWLLLYFGEHVLESELSQLCSHTPVNVDFILMISGILKKSKRYYLNILKISKRYYLNNVLFWAPLK